MGLLGAAALSPASFPYRDQRQEESPRRSCEETAGASTGGPSSEDQSALFRIIPTANPKKAPTLARAS